MKSITIIRHAKATWNSSSEIDFDRPLHNKGLKDAEIIGNTLAKKSTTFDIILSSPAKRAITTANIIANKMKLNKCIKEDERIYTSTSNTLFNIILSLNNSINLIAIIGHNPTLHILSEQLSREKFIKFPTCSTVKINFKINRWDEIKYGNLEYYLFPELLN